MQQTDIIFEDERRGNSPRRYVLIQVDKLASIEGVVWKSDIDR
ncbi:hypothetical protein [Candidatus Chlorohelix allophototropha]